MAVRDSESYHSRLRLLLFCTGVVLERFFKLQENKPTLQRELRHVHVFGVLLVRAPMIWIIQIMESSF